MFGWKKDKAAAASRPARAKNPNRPQLHLFDIPGLDDNIEDNDEDDSDLEAELLALQSGNDTRRVVPRRRPEPSGLDAVQKMAAECMKDDDEDDEDIDENDPELLSELLDLDPEVNLPVATTQPKIPEIPKPSSVPAADADEPASGPLSGPALIQILESRTELYRSALENARTANDSAKIRRLDRGIKTLQQQMKTAQAGRSVNTEDIPAKVSSGQQQQSNRQVMTDVELPGIVAAEEEPSAPPVPPRLRPAPPPPKQIAPLPPVVAPRPASQPVIAPQLTPLPRTVAPQPPVSAPPAAMEIAEQDAPNDTQIMLCTRRDQYKRAALSAKSAGDVGNAAKYLKISKQFDRVLDALNQGQPVDLSGMPPPPPGVNDIQNNSAPTTTITRTNETPGPAGDAPVTLLNMEIPTEPEDPTVFNAPPPPVTVLDALQQRLAKYQSAAEEAKAAENTSKMRRMGRIVKQYEDAIKAHKAGKPVNYEELPTPPGFAPIPTGNAPAPAASAPPPKVPAPAPVVQSPPEKEPPLPPKPADAEPQKPPAVPPKAPLQRQVSRAAQSLHERQLTVLLERQRLFKEAALDAKKRQDIEAAKEYLRVAKGFEPMIQASKCGLPVNMESIPTPPQLEADSAMEATEYEIVKYEDCEDGLDRDEVYKKLKGDLEQQMDLCARNQAHFAKQGDIQNAIKFENQIKNSRKDLTALTAAYKNGHVLPRFHYESKTFSVVICNTELIDNDLELSIVRGINYYCSNPKEIDTYVKFEFPFPAENHQKNKTATVYNTNNPEYNVQFVLPISRNSRAFARTVKRHAIKIEIWVKGGFLRSDQLLGTASVKLLPLETKCEIHDTFDVMDGRKPLGGKIEIKVRIREPLLTKQVENRTEKWLVLST